jgi:hypothetical protein
MSQQGTRDLAWWRIPAWAPAFPRVMATALLFGLVFAIGGRPEYGLVGGVVSAYFYMIAERRKAPVRRASLNWRHMLSRKSLALGLEFALVGGGMCVLFGFAIRIGASRTGALSVGIAIGVGLAGAISSGLARSATDDASPLTPRASWRLDQAFGIAVGVILGLGLSLGVGIGVGLIQALGLGAIAGHAGAIAYGIGWVLLFGLVFGVQFPRTWTVSLSFAQLSVRWQTPVRLLRFLEDARQRNILRTVGPVYLFRHARLQDRLAMQAKSM